MAISLSNLASNLAEGIHKIKCIDCDYFFEYESVNGNLTKCKCLSCNKNYSSKIDEKLNRSSRIHLSFLIMMLKNLFCCGEKVFILMKKWMNMKIYMEKSLMKYHCIKKRFLY